MEKLNSAPKYSTYCYTVYNTVGDAEYQVWYCQQRQEKVMVVV